MSGSGKHSICMSGIDALYCCMFDANVKTIYYMTM